MRSQVIAVTVLSAALLSGCANMSETGRTTATGAGLGAAAGAAIGALAGGGKGAAIGAGVGAAAGAGGGYIWSQRMQRQKQELEQATGGTGVAISQTSSNELKVEIPSDLSFDTGQANIKPDMRPFLDRLAGTLMSNPGTTVRIVGHTDSTGGDAVNEPLSLRRAASARDYLVAGGVARERIEIYGRGSADPVASNANTSGRAQNRRVEIYVAERTA